MAEMTPKLLKKICIDHKGYGTPYLNEKLYLQCKGWGRIQGLDEYTGLRALWLPGLPAGVQNRAVGNEIRLNLSLVHVRVMARVDVGHCCAHQYHVS